MYMNFLFTSHRHKTSFQSNLKFHCLSLCVYQAKSKPLPLRSRTETLRLFYCCVAFILSFWFNKSRLYIPLVTVLCSKKQTLPNLSVCGSPFYLYQGLKLKSKNKNNCSECVVVLLCGCRALKASKRYFGVANDPSVLLGLMPCCSPGFIRYCQS